MEDFVFGFMSLLLIQFLSSFSDVKKICMKHEHTDHCSKYREGFLCDIKYLKTTLHRLLRRISL